MVDEVRAHSLPGEPRCARGWLWPVAAREGQLEQANGPRLWAGARLKGGHSTRAGRGKPPQWKWLVAPMPARTRRRLVLGDSHTGRTPALAGFGFSARAPPHRTALLEPTAKAHSAAAVLGSTWGRALHGSRRAGPASDVSDSSSSVRRSRLVCISGVVGSQAAWSDTGPWAKTMPVMQTARAFTLGTCRM